MANNLFVSYDLIKHGQNYPAVSAAIRKLGKAAKVHLSLWYIKSDYDAEQAANSVWAAMDNNDKLLVIDTTNNHAAWFGLDDQTSRFLQENWSL